MKKTVHKLDNYYNELRMLNVVIEAKEAAVRFIKYDLQKLHEQRYELLEKINSLE